MSSNPSSVFVINSLSKKYVSSRRQVGEKPSLLRKESNTHTVLHNLSLEIRPGETVAFIGSNGSGKSTLLKILARLTKPSEGQVIIRGKVGALLELSAGFHSELTGRQNIYLSGAILGMTPKQIKEQLDQIISFAGIASFIDMPVKHYSSGMFMRLAFSVMSHLDNDALILDEVAAVGDLSFQKQWENKLYELKQQRKTILIVSHQLDWVESFCERTIWLEKGHILADGPTKSIFSKYRQAFETQ